MSVILVLTQALLLTYKMVFRLEKEFVSGSYTYDMKEEGLIKFDRFQGTFIIGFILENL